MASNPSRKLTYDDYAAFPDDNIRREIVDGKVYVTPSATTRHQILVGRVFNALFNHLEENGGGIVFVAPMDLLLSPHDIVQPDVVFVADDRIATVTEPNLKGTATLNIEVVSDSRHDRIRKRALYERTGTPNYWILDPVQDRVEVYRLTEGRYNDPEIFVAGDTITLAELPGFTLDCTWLLRR